MTKEGGTGKARAEWLEVEVQGITLDTESKNPVLLLREKEGTRVLPIWIGLFEAHAIASHLGGVKPPRPLTHDLIASLLAGAGISVLEVRVTGLEGNTFFAEVLLATPAGPVGVDSRPSDAVALAVRTGAPVKVRAPVMERSSVDAADRKTKEGEGDPWKEILQGLDPKDFPKWRM